MRFVFSLLFVTAFFVSRSNAQEEEWKGQWITQSWPPVVENTWTCLVKEVDLDLLPPVLEARIATDSKYWLWINDSLVVFEGQLKRGPTPHDTYYDKVDIAPFLRKGKNVIAALVWFWGRDGYCHKNSGAMGFLFDAQSKEVTIVSDTSWKTLIHPAYGNTSDPIPNFRLPEYNVKFYAGKDIPGWRKPGASTNWNKAVVRGPAGAAPWNKLWPRPFPLWKNSGLVAYENKLNFPFVSDGSPVVMKLPKNYSITPYLYVEADSNLLIDLRTDNYKGGANTTYVRNT